MGLMQGDYPLRTYLIMAVVGLSIGLVLSYFRLKPLIELKFNFFDYTKTESFTMYEIPRTFRAVGIFGLIMVLYKTGWFKWLFALVRPVGQMAFTNYLMQSLICGIIFYGIGFGLFGKLQRYELYYIVAAIWVFQIIASHLWLRNYRFGPMEWIWRSLTYWRTQPFRKTKEVEGVIGGGGIRRLGVGSETTHNFIGKDKVVKFLYSRMSDVVLCSLPKFLSLIDKHDALTNTHYRVHVMRDHDRSDVEIFRNILDEVVDHD
jgi:hypothetical protein